jgi:hypothetical protein
MKFVLLLLLFAAALHAHPLDDKADMQAQVRIASERELELTLEFCYRDVVAGYTEFRNGLDRDLNGTVTREEARRRFGELAPEVAFGIGLSLDGKALNLEPDFARFEFKDLDNPSATAEIDTSTARIMYRFVYTWIAAAPLAPGEHKIEFFFNGAQTVVHTPKQQLKAVDAQGNPLPTDYDLALHAFPRLTATFAIAQPHISPQPPSTADESFNAPTGYGEMPGWLTFAVGGAIAVMGLALLARRVMRRTGSGIMACALTLAGAAIVLGSLLKLAAFRA